MAKLINLIKNNRLLLFCLLIIIIQFFQILFFKQGLFLEKYDPEYWKDRFEHSQYKLPLSQRIMGDDSLYSYAGYSMLHGVGIENTTTFKPPVMLYMLGFSIQIFNNPLIIEYLFSIGTIFCFFLIALELLKNKKLALVVTAFLVLDPFIFSNFYISLLDLPQLFFLLLHLILLLYSQKHPRYKVLLILLSGLSLGLFTETKPPMLLPIIMILELIYLYKQKMLKLLIPFGFGFVFGVFIPYIPYLRQGNNLIDFLKLHKYMAFVYYSGHNQLFPLAIWQSLFIGSFPDVVSGKLNRLSDWWILLPVVTVIGIFGAIKNLFGKDYFVKGLSIFALITLTIYTIVPSYPRYTILVIPFLYLFSASLLKKYINSRIINLLIIFILIFGLFNSTKLLLPNSNAVLETFKYNFSHSYFQDMYQESLSKSIKSDFTKEQFRFTTQGTLLGGQIIEVTFKELGKNISYIKGEGDARYLLTYKTTNLGNFSQEKTINLILENGLWKINWNWNLLLNDFKPGRKLNIDLIPGKRGTILDRKGNILASDEISYLIKINPDKIDTKREMDMITLLSKISLQEKMHLQNAYLENALPNTYVDVATPFMELSDTQLNELRSYPGLTLTPHASRIYGQLAKFLPINNTSFNECCTKIYSSSSYHGVIGVEEKFDKILSGQNGGTLSLTDANGKIIKTLISRQPKFGQNLITSD